MRHIKTEGPIGERHAKWRESAREECNKLIKEYAETKITPEPNPKIWADLKDTFLTDLFFGKCAYCEAYLQKAHFPAHVDHYRPKKRVKENGIEIDHPGYFWLAYEWHNLLPVCHNCNSGHSERVGSRKVSHSGKGNEFPICGSRVNTPSENPDIWRDELRETEQPLLLNPYDDIPESYISFGEAGVPFPINNNPRAVATIKIYHLDRIELCAEREAYAEEHIISWMHNTIEKMRRGKNCITPNSRDCCITLDSQFTLWLKVALRKFISEMVERDGLEIID